MSEPRWIAKAEKRAAEHERIASAILESATAVRDRHIEMARAERQRVATYRNKEEA